jgi:hypothetical protein
MEADVRVRKWLIRPMKLVGKRIGGKLEVDILRTARRFARRRAADAVPELAGDTPE